MVFNEVNQAAQATVQELQEILGRRSETLLFMLWIYFKDTQKTTAKRRKDKKTKD